VIAVASASDDEGKSFASSLLATVLTRETGGKVLLIDADAARATLSDRVRRSGGEALRDLALTGGDAPIETSEPGVDLMLQPPRDQRVVARLPQWLRQSIEGARGRYDLVVIDTPSLDQGPGGMLCCDQADVVLLVVKRQATRKGPVRQALRTLREAAVSPAGVILNFANSRN
jgi:Mrp family chromosome partitioning ATPase